MNNPPVGEQDKFAFFPRMGNNDVQRLKKTLQYYEGMWEEPGNSHAILIRKALRISFAIACLRKYFLCPVSLIDFLNMGTYW